MEITKESLILGIECAISPRYAQNDSFSAILIEYKDKGTDRLYVFEDCDGDVWDCSLDEIDEVFK